MTWIDFDLDDPAIGGRLRDAGLEIDLQPKKGARTTHEVITLLGGATAAIVSTDPFSASVFEALPDLRTISRVGVGVDSIDLDAASRAGVLVSVTPGRNEETTADHTLALMLAALRRVTEHDRGIRDGRWERAGEWTAWDLHGKTVGLVGYGRIGRAVHSRLVGFGVNVVITDPAINAGENGARCVPLDQLLAEADVVSLHLPLTDGTRGIIDRERLGLMRKNAVLVNTARGGLIEEEALVRALKSGSLRAASLDVFSEEPPHGSELLELPNVVLSPHIGGLSDRSIRGMTEQATQNVLDVLAGKVTDAVVNPEAAALDGRRSQDPDASVSGREHVS